MIRRHLIALSLLLLAPSVVADSPPAGADYEGEAFTFHQVREGIYHAVGTGQLAVGCNGAVVINEDDVLIVDSHMTPAAGWALREELKKITQKPIRYIINTHFHFDHAHGNQIFGPDVEIIAHSFTHQKLASGESKQGRAYESFVLALPENIEKAKAAAAGLEGEEKAALEERISGMQKFWDASQATEVRPPTMTLDQRMVLHRGGREIQLLYSGRGHTGGDVAVYLPAEKILITGDLLTEGLPYMGDSFPADWIDTLEALAQLDFDTVLPGHGQVFEGKAKMRHLQAYLRDLWAAATKAHQDGVSAEEAAKTLDLSHHAENYPQIQGPGVHPHAIARIYEILDGE